MKRIHYVDFAMTDTPTRPKNTHRTQRDHFIDKDEQMIDSDDARNGRPGSSPEFRHRGRMKCLVLAIVFFCVLAISACTANQSETYHYIVYRTVSYIEKTENVFANGEDEIYVSIYAESTVFTSSFSDATVFVHTDGSLSVIFSDGWSATCPADASVDGCSISPNPRHRDEFNSLIGFRDVVILTETIDPQIENPTVAQTTARKIWFWSILGLVAIISLLMILLPKGGRGFLHPSGTLRGGKIIGRNNGENVKNYWLYNVGDSIETIHADVDDRYGKSAGTTPPPPTTTLADRIRAKWPYLLLSVIVLGLAIAALLIFVI